ncbi:MAG TPA: hypothetical protein VJX67_05505 [Blastocatellia bacterium]|nr:hypothetical protein [Blastocatellia bacterium]
MATPDCYRSFSHIASAIATAMSWSPKPSPVVVAPAAGRPSEFRLLWVVGVVGPDADAGAHSLLELVWEQSANAKSHPARRARFPVREA